MVIEMEPNRSPIDVFPNFDGNTHLHAKFHQLCLDWFTKFISHEFRSLPPQLTAYLGVDQNCDAHVKMDVIAKLVTAVSSASNTSLKEIASSLPKRDGVLVTGSQYELEHNSETSHAELSLFRLVFILLGWASMMYEPVSNGEPEQSQLQIKTLQSPPTSSRFRKQRSVSTNFIAIDDAASISFPQLMAKFGKRLPEKGTSSNAAASARQISEDTIKATNVFYSNLRRVGKLNLKWVHSLDRHLDLNEKARTLEVFAFPSYCALVCLSSTDSTKFLNSLLGKRNSSSMEDKQGLFEDYSREILISFGIIFGQERMSREQAAKELVGNRPDSGVADGFLKDLCTKRWNEHLLFDYLDSPPTRSNYSGRADFPYLGKKLLKVQAYMDDQSPNDFATLVFDRRDPLRFWTFVTAIVIGGLSILMNIIQIGLTAAQLGVPS